MLWSSFGKNLEFFGFVCMFVHFILNDILKFYFKVVISVCSLTYCLIFVAFLMEMVQFWGCG